MIDELLIMPHHMHGILLLRKRNLVGALYTVGAQYIEPRRERLSPQRDRLNKFQKLVPESISSIIRYHVSILKAHVILRERFVMEISEEATEGSDSLNSPSK